MGAPPGDITEILRGLPGSPEALKELYEKVYDELHRLARIRMAGERKNHTLQPTALVNEAFVRLAGSSLKLENRNHFFALAARTLRRILTDYARQRYAQKRGGGAWEVTFDEGLAPVRSPEGMLELENLLQKLGEEDPEGLAVVELRYFGGLTVEECAEALSVSEDTVKRRWRKAKIWLFHHLDPESEKDCA